MRRFSERHGFILPRQAIQKNGMDERLRNRLWTVCGAYFWNHFGRWWQESDFDTFVIHVIQDEFFGRPVDELWSGAGDVVSDWKRWVKGAQWNEVYDFIQFLGDFSKVSEAGEPYSSVRMHGQIFIGKCNEVLEAEKSAYRFVSGELCEITDEVEIAALEDATNADAQFSTASMHIQKALALYASRENPDYNNSVKESISAIEAAFSVINGEKSKNMSSAIRLAEGKGFKLQPALKSGILNLYGWTSDENGVRHAMFDDTSQLSEAQAKLMLVICSGLMNYMVVTQSERNS